MQVQQILETCLYAPDLAAAEAFFNQVLGLEPFARVAGRHVFFDVGPLFSFYSTRPALPKRRERYRFRLTGRTDQVTWRLPLPQPSCRCGETICNSTASRSKRKLPGLRAANLSIFATRPATVLN